MITDYWPLFALGLLCGVMAYRAWRLMKAPPPPARHPREDWADWEEVCQRARAKRAAKGIGQ
jgi:hypothetical protein